MVEETSIKFKKIDMIWQFTVDILDLKYNMKKLARKVSDSKLVCAYVRPHTAEEQLNGQIETGFRKDMNASVKSKIDLLLKEIYESDFNTLDKEYLEAQNFTRFLLKSIKIRLPFNEKMFDCDIVLTITKLGIAVFNFWVHIDVELNSNQIAELQLLPTKEVEIVVEIPRELLFELKNMSEKYLKYYEKTSKIKPSILLSMDFEVLIFLYWCSLINILNNRSFKSKYLEDFEIIKNKKYRYEARYIFPLVIVKITEPAYSSTEDMIQQHPKQLYQILSHLDKIDYNIIRLSSTVDFLEPNLSERQDIAFLNSTGSVLLLFGSETQEIRRHLLEAFCIIEIIQIQRYFFGFLISKLNQPFKKINVRKISIMRSYFSTGLNMYYTKLTANSLASKRLSNGKRIMELDDSYEMLNNKIDLLGEALQSFSQLKNSVFEITVAAILGFLSVFFIFLPSDNDIINLIFGTILLCITAGSLLGFFIVSKFVWKWLKSKKI